MISKFKGLNMGKDNMNMMMRNPKQLQEKLMKAMNPQ